MLWFNHILTPKQKLQAITGLDLGWPLNLIYLKITENVYTLLFLGKSVILICFCYPVQIDS